MQKSRWLKKSLVVLVSVLTFGMVSPSDISWRTQAHSDKHAKKDIFEEAESTGYSLLESADDPISTTIFDRSEFIESMMAKAQDHAFTKFGAKIGPKIEDEFKFSVLPKIEEAITQMAVKFPDEELVQLTISKGPSSGRGEKIFHIFNENTGKDIIRFHVRQENPPQEGYWFNFHYHTYHDEFATHYALGKIYWNKNTPPKWSEQTYFS
ncbi:YpjP family protein [Peribacillus sp. JNUCC 23]